MDAPAVLYALRWLIHDTFRQTLTSRVFWILLGLSGMCIVFCLGVSVEGGAVREGHEFFVKGNKPLAAPGAEAGRLTLLYGLFPITFSRTAEEQVHFLLNIFASWIAGTIGIVMALVWTAGFVPESLHPSAAAVLLAKPAPRWLILLGKYLGIICFVGLHVTIFFVGTWLALGLRTGYFPAKYLAGIPLMTFHFAVIFSFSILIAVLFRSTMACVVGGVLFWVVCSAVNHGRHFAVVYAELNPGQALPEFTVFLSEISYWALPKPVDLTILLEKTLNLGAGMMTLADQRHIGEVLNNDLLHPIGSVVTSCIFPAFALWASASHLSKADY